MTQGLAMGFRRSLLPALAGLAVALASCSSPQPEVKSVNVAEAKQNLEIVAAARILLGHQSVGRDVLAGVKSLADETGVALRIEEIPGGLPTDDGPGLFHARIGKNGDPESKCQAFGSLLSRTERPRYDLAMMKFCYVDLAGDTPAQATAMLERYSKLVSALRADRPDVRLMHVTMPLRAERQGWKTTLKRMLGRDIPEDRDNELRNAFNDGLRQRYSSGPFFDLAEAESTRGDGSRSAFTRDGRTIYTLAREYTHDGGHLKPEAQRVIAAEFLRTVATALRQREHLTRDTG
jgi:lysophospholipase L1-like esterase